MYCPNCGSKVPDDALFCPECGFKLDQGEDIRDDRDDYSDYTGREEAPQGERDFRSLYNDDADRTYPGGQDPDEAGSDSYQDTGNYGYEQNNRDSFDQNDKNDNQFDWRAYGDHAEPDSRDMDHYDTDYPPEEEDRHSMMPVIILIIAVAASALVVFGYFFMKNNPDFHLFGGGSSESTSTSESNESDSGKESISSEKESVTAVPTATPTPASAPKATVTPVPTATPTPTAVPTQIPTDPSATAVSGDYVFPNSSTVSLTESDLAGKTAWELTVARNEICARHGYTFNRTDLQNYFDQKSWYHRVGQFNISEVLSSTELRNMTFIQNYQDAHNLNG